MLLLLLSMPVIALFTLGHSEAALRYAVAQLPTKAGSLEKLQIDNLRGTLAGGFTVDRIVIEHDLVYLRIDGVRANRTSAAVVADHRCQQLRSSQPRDCTTATKSAATARSKTVSPATADTRSTSDPSAIDHYQTTRGIAGVVRKRDGPRHHPRAAYLDT